MRLSCCSFYLSPCVPLYGLAIFFISTTLAASAQRPVSPTVIGPGQVGIALAFTPAPGQESESASGRSASIATESAVVADLELPDAPSAQQNAPAARALQPVRTPRFAPAPQAPLFNKYIEPGQSAQPLRSVRQKVLFGLDQIVSPYYLVSIVSSAGYEQAMNGRPNYGTNITAFGQRVGASAATNASQSLFTDGLMPAVLHQDPRYYVMGRGHSVFARGGYAISRVFVTRSDAGDRVANYSLFAGHAFTASLQNAYFPEINQGASETAKSYATSFGGTALSNAIREFFPDLLHLARLE